MTRMLTIIALLFATPMLASCAGTPKVADVNDNLFDIKQYHPTNGNLNIDVWTTARDYCRKSSLTAFHLSSVRSEITGINRHTFRCDDR
jgi:uncharacterized FlgJ-related protein